jgi:hypothetical protein
MPKRHSAPPAASCSITRWATRNAALAAGMPAYTEVWIRISEISSGVRPLRSAPRT